MTNSSLMSKQNLSYKDNPQGYPTWGGGKSPWKPVPNRKFLEQLQIPRFIIPKPNWGVLYHTQLTSWGNFNDPFSYISIRSPQWPKLTILTNIGPDSRLATKIRPLPFYTAEESNACKSLIQNEVIYLTREGDQVNNRALYTWLKLGWSSPSVFWVDKRISTRPNSWSIIVWSLST